MVGEGNRFFAAIYEPLMSGTEKKGLRDIRARLLAEAGGRTLELGAGTGLNLAHYPEAVTELVLTEPDPHMAKRLRRTVAEADLPATASVREVGAEELPFEHASFDTVVCGLVLCTVGDPETSIREIARVLRPGGRLLFVEHVRGEDGTRLARWQDRLERPWGMFAGGCHPNRRTVEALEASGLEAQRVEMDLLPGAPPIVRPLAIGVATRPG